jgi:hypothetical protein
LPLAAFPVGAILFNPSPALPLAETADRGGLLARVLITDAGGLIGRALRPPLASTTQR